MGGGGGRSKKDAAANAARSGGAGGALEAAPAPSPEVPWSGLSAEAAVMRALESLASGDRRHAWSDDEGAAHSSPHGQVPIPLLRDLLDRKTGRAMGDAEFRAAVVSLARSGKVDIVPISLLFRFNKSMRDRTISGANEFWGFLEAN